MEIQDKTNIDHHQYLRWRRHVINQMIDSENVSQCLAAMSRGIRELRGEPEVRSIHQAVNRGLEGHTIGDLTPLVESDGTGADLNQI